MGKDIPGIPLLLHMYQPILLSWLHSPSGLKVPGVLQDQQDPREECEGRTQVSAVCLGSRILVTKAWLVNSDGVCPDPLLPSLGSASPSLTGAPGGPGSPWPPCWGQSDERGQSHPGKVGNDFHWGLAQDGSRSEGSNVLTAGPGVPLGPCRPCRRKGLMNLGPGLTLACFHLLRALPGEYCTLPTSQA